MQIFVGSHNPVKINAALSAAAELWPDVRVEGFDVPSGVPDQPLSDEETKMGASQRAVRSLEQGLKKAKIKPVEGEQLGLGAEGGVFETGDEMWSTVWACVADTSGRVVCANGARFQVPEDIAKLVRSGEEMGPAVAKLAGVEDLKRKQGMIGLISNNLLTRTEEYSAIIKTSLGIWYGQFKPWQKQ